MALVAFGCSNPEAQFSDFKPLVGTWRLTDPGRDYEEIWTADGEQLKGSAVEIADGDTAFFEDMTIFHRGEDGWVLGVSVQKQNSNSTIYFRLKNFKPGYFQFENATHDFPQRIIYEMTSDTSMIALVDDGAEGDRKVDFDFVRVSE
jgi:hypothetical protein